MIEFRLERAVAAGLSIEQIRTVNLWNESLRRLIDEDPPAVPERLGSSEGTAPDLAEPLG